VGLFYAQLLKALPDLEVEIRHKHVADDSILVEVLIRGTHFGAWRGLPATGRRGQFPIFGVYTFDADDRLAGEKIYYDRGTILKQLGVFREPEPSWGKSPFWGLIRLRLPGLLPGSSCAVIFDKL
jgi:hypothetical protein